jgi:hypothetical protein
MMPILSSYVNPDAYRVQAEKSPALSKNALDSMKIPIWPFMIKQQVLDDLMVEQIPTNNNNILLLTYLLGSVLYQQKILD